MRKRSVLHFSATRTIIHAFIPSGINERGGESKDNGTILLTNNNNNKEKRERTFCFLCIVLQLIQPDQKQLKEE